MFAENQNFCELHHLNQKWPPQAKIFKNYSHPSLSRHRKGPGNNVEIERGKGNVEITRDFSYITIM